MAFGRRFRRTARAFKRLRRFQRRHGGGPAGTTMNQVVRSLPLTGGIPPPTTLDQALQYARVGLIRKDQYGQYLAQFKTPPPPPPP
jgi:hypothetical protein